MSIVNIAAMNIGVHCLSKLEILSFLNICSVEGLLDHMVTLFLVFEGTSLLLSKYIYFLLSVLASCTFQRICSL